MTNLTAVWREIEHMLDQGISIIPVRDKATPTHAAKTPYSGWKAYQSTLISKQDLWYQMEQHNTTAVAMVCGTVSGYLEVIDIDVKFQAGIEILLLNNIRETRPDLYNILRLHRSPSNGVHIPYRIASLPPSGMPGNLKLAKRPPTPEELATDPKAKPKTTIETRGEGGYVLVPPSMGYSVVLDRPIPTISWEDRESLINMCKLLDQLPKTTPPPARTKADMDYYEESPWDHFNASPAAEDVLLSNGWKLHSKNSQYTHYTRPGKTSGVSASFIHSTRMYFMFTTNGGLEADRGYHPSTLLAELQFNGDRKATYRYLVSQGFGKINPKVEPRIIKKATVSGQPLPANISPEAREQYAQVAAEMQEKYPHGIFWTNDEEGAYSISRERLVWVAAAMGFRLYRGEPVRIATPLLHKCQPRDFFDALKSYIKEEDPEEYFAIADCLEGFIQRSGTFTITRLPILPASELLRDTATTAYKAYQNTVVAVTARNITQLPYNGLPGLIWAHNVQPRDFHFTENPAGKYVEFLNLACEYQLRRHYIQSILGYLAHDHKDETTGYIITLTEQCPDPKDGGGSGKNMFGNLLRYTTTYVSKAGSQTKFDEKFFQVWKGERIFAISDVPKHFDFAFLKEPATGSGVLKKLFRDEEVIAVEDMPKFMVQTNYSYEISDGGLRRRIIPLEFTDFFTQAGGIDVHFGCHFPAGWDQEDWDGFDNTIILSLQTWLAANRKIKAVPLTETGWEKQFEHTYGVICMDIIRECIDMWQRLGFVNNQQFREHLEGYYREHGTSKQFQPSAGKINKAIQDYTAHHGIKYEFPVVRRVGMGIAKGRIFDSQTDLPF